jgi:hypothetical protein
VQNSRLVVRNTYGLDPKKPSFDSIVSQEYGSGGTITFRYHDLIAESEPGAPPSPDASLVTSRNDFKPVSICNERCALPLRERMNPVSYSALDAEHFVAFSTQAPSATPVVRVSSAFARPTLIALHNTREGVLFDTRALAATSEQSRCLLQRLSPCRWFRSTPSIHFESKDGRVDLVASTRPGMLTARTSGRVSLSDLFDASGNATVLAPRSGRASLERSRPQALIRIWPARACRPRFSVEYDALAQRAIFSPADACKNLTQAFQLGTNLSEYGDVSAIPGAAQTPLLPLSLLRATVLTPGPGLFDTGRTHSASAMRPGGLPQDARDLAGASGVFRATLDPEQLRERSRVGFPEFTFHLPVLTPTQPGVVFDPRDPIGDLVRSAHLRNDATNFLFENGIRGACRTILTGPAEKPQPSDDDLPATATVVVDRHGQEWTLYFDRNGRNIRSTNQTLKATWEVNFSPEGNPVGLARPSGSYSCRRYDSDGYLTEIRDVPAPARPGRTESVHQIFKMASVP